MRRVPPANLIAVDGFTAAPVAPANLIAVDGFVANLIAGTDSMIRLHAQRKGR